MTGIPEMTVCEPCDPVQAKKMIDASFSYEGPMYIRSTVESVKSVYDESYNFEIGKATVVKDGMTELLFVQVLLCNMLWKRLN